MGLIHERDRARQFWDKVEKTDACWLWQGALTSAGYGCLTVNKRRVYAHRLSYEIATGIHPGNLKVCHNCPGGDNPACVNPAHLWLGTDLDNARDRERKGRGVRPTRRAA